MHRLRFVWLFVLCLIIIPAALWACNGLAIGTGCCLAEGTASLCQDCAGETCAVACLADGELAEEQCLKESFNVCLGCDPFPLPPPPPAGGGTDPVVPPTHTHPYYWDTYAGAYYDPICGVWLMTAYQGDVRYSYN